MRRICPGYAERVYGRGGLFSLQLRNKQNPYGAESIKICENLAENAKDKEIAYAATHLLICLYRDMGDTARAIACAQRMPCPYRCRELALSSACDGKAGEMYHGQALLTLCGTLVNEIIQALVCNAHNFDTDLCIDTVQGAIQLFDVVCEDGRFGEYYGNLMELYLFLAYVQWMRGYQEEAFASLDTAYDFSRKCENVCDGIERSYTSMFLKKIQADLRWTARMEKCRG